MRDFFGRKEKDDFSFAQDEKRLVRWDQGLKHYSDFLSNGKNKTSNETASLLGNMFNVMGISKKQKFSANTSDSNTLRIPIALLGKGSEKVEGDKTDIFYGTAIHEAAYKTAFNGGDLRKVDQIKLKAKQKDLPNFISSLLTDEYVHRDLSKNFPGYSKFVQKMKADMYTNMEKVNTDKGNVAEILDLAVKLIRYPKDIDPEMLEKYAPLVKYMEQAFDKYDGIPKSLKDIETLSAMLSQTMIKYIVEPPPPPEEEKPDKSDKSEEEKDYSEKEENPESPKKDEPKDEDSEGDSKKDEPKDEPKDSKSDKDESEDNSDESGKDSGDKSDENSDSDENDSDKNSDDSDSDSDSDGDPFGESTPGKPTPTSSDIQDELESMLGKYNETLMDTIPEDDSAEKKIESFVDNLYDNDKAITGKIPLFIEKAIGNKKQYEYDMKQIDLTKSDVLRKLLSRKIKDYQICLKSMRSGRLDTNKLAEAVQRVPTIYEQYGQVTTDNICIGVLIDESGSMCGDRISKARQAAIFIEQTFGKLANADLFIYGHSADQRKYESTELYIYREPGFNVPYALGSVDDRSQNRDGDAIYHASERMRKHSQHPGILIVLSDGEPAASNYGGNSGIEDTRKKVAISEKKFDLKIFQISLVKMDSSRMFKHFVYMKDIKTLPQDLTKFLTQQMDKMLKEHTRF